MQHIFEQELTEETEKNAALEPIFLRKLAMLFSLLCCLCCLLFEILKDAHGKRGTWYPRLPPTIRGSCSLSKRAAAASHGFFSLSSEMETGETKVDKSQASDFIMTVGSAPAWLRALF